MKPEMRLACLICGTQSNDLLHMQKHVMQEHGYRHEDHRQVTRRETADAYIWTMPDGIDWLRAAKSRFPPAGEAPADLLEQ